jgi:hypothetical protein
MASNRSRRESTITTMICFTPAELISRDAHCRLMRSCAAIAVTVFPSSKPSAMRIRRA